MQLLLYLLDTAVVSAVQPSNSRSRPAILCHLLSESLMSLLKRVASSFPFKIPGLFYINVHLINGVQLSDYDYMRG